MSDQLIHVMHERSNGLGDTGRDRRVKFTWYIGVPVDLPGKPFAIKEIATAEVDPVDVHGAHTKSILTDAEAEDWLTKNDVTLRMNIYPRAYRIQEVMATRVATEAEVAKILESLRASRDFNLRLADDTNELIKMIDPKRRLATPQPNATDESKEVK